MADEKITWTDAADPSKSGTETIDGDLFDEGPEDDEDFDRFNAENDRNEKMQAWQAWQAWLAEAGNRSVLDAKRLARRVTRQMRATGKRPISVTRPSKSQYGKAPGNNQPPPPMETVQVHISEADWLKGPPDKTGNFPHQTDFLTGYVDDAGKDTIWSTYLQDHEYQESQEAQLFDGKSVRSYLGGDDPNVRCLDCLKIKGFKTNTKKKWGAVVLGGLLVGAGIYFGGTNGVAPGNVQATCSWADFGKSSVTVTWTSAGPPLTTQYSVTLTNTAKTVTSTQVVTDGLCSALFTDLPDGTYTATVQTVANDIASRSAQASVTVAQPTVTDTVVPNAPTNVVASLGTAAPGTIVVKWNSATVPPRVTSYNASLISPATGTTVVKTISMIAATECSFTMLGPGDYKVTVTSHNDAGDGGSASSGTVTVPKTVDPNPQPPRNLRLMPYLSDATSKPGIAVLWDAPVDTTGITGYAVSMSVGTTALDTKVTGGSTIIGYANLADGAYTASVVSQNGTYMSTAVSTGLNLVAANIPPDTIDWGLYFDPDEVKQWKAANDVLASTDEKTFWADVLDAVADTGNNYGGTASYPEQFQLAQVLKTWITLPKADPSLLQCDQLAARLAAATTPPFPLKPAAPGNEYADHLALWKAASTLKNALGMGEETLRYKLFAIERVLELYLTPEPVHERVYDPTTVPAVKQLDGANNDVETAQRFVFAKAGKVNGVWWYRYAEDLGPITVSAWKGTTSLAEATGDPAVKVGWAYLPFAAPVPVAANDKLIIGVHHPNGAYGKNENGFTGKSRSSANITSPSSTAAEPNGLFEYSKTPVLPSSSFKDSEYYISPDFTPN